MNTESENKTSCNGFFACKAPWLLIVIGILELILGAFMIFFPMLTGLVTMWVGGFLFLALAILGIIQLFTNRRKSGLFWSILNIILLLILGYYMVTESAAALGTWTLVLGIYILVMGFFRLGMAFSLRKRKGFGWALFSAIISVALGAMITFGWPASSFIFIGTLVGIEFIITGWTMIMLGVAGRDN